MQFWANIPILAIIDSLSTVAWSQFRKSRVVGPLILEASTCETPQSRLGSRDVFRFMSIYMSTFSDSINHLVANCQVCGAYSSFIFY